MKVGYKTRRGRKRSPVPHRSHRTAGATKDPLIRQERADRRRRKVQIAAELLDQEAA